MKQTKHHLSIHIDEAGRGPLAGPVWVGGIMKLGSLSKSELSPFQDSKTLTAARREQAYQIISRLEESGKLIYAGGNASARDIDTHGIIRSLQYACIKMIYNLIIKRYRSTGRAVLSQSTKQQDKEFVTYMDVHCDALSKRKPNMETTLLVVKYFLHAAQSVFVFDGLVLDGNHTFGLDKALDCKVTTIIKGDASNPLISAASIVAKVQRDAYMQGLDKRYPQRQFGIHKGYGTAAHTALIAKRGPSKEHRKTWLHG
ncbi:MAG: ribonuclease HII [Candidatus Absconditabacterales bacterium]